jgi:hypothetical protein
MNELSLTQPSDIYDGLIIGHFKLYRLLSLKIIHIYIYIYNIDLHSHHRN